MAEGARGDRLGNSELILFIITQHHDFDCGFNIRKYRNKRDSQYTACPWRQAKLAKCSRLSTIIETDAVESSRVYVTLAANQ